MKIKRENACEKLLVYYRALRDRSGDDVSSDALLSVAPYCRTSAHTATLLGQPFTFLPTVAGSQDCLLFFLSQSHSTIDGRSHKSSVMSGP